MNAGKDKDAQAAYASLEKSSNTEVAAESLYAKAFYQSKAKAFKSSNETIFKLANNYSSEEYWGAKALVLMAKNYVGLKTITRRAIHAIRLSKIIKIFRRS